MSQEDIAIKVEGVSKTFKLPHEKQTSIKGLFVNLFKGKRTYEKQHVLKNISFEIKKGEFFGIVGRNGSGKSTLLKLLAGIYSPDKGHIQVNGKLTPFIELGVGFNPELTGKENVFLNGALLGFNRKEMDSMYDEIVEFAELEKFMDQKLKNYSSGMQVRLAFSIAIRAKSDILLIDEVLAVGDQGFQDKCHTYFSKIKNSSKTVIFVTHDMSSVERFCDRVLLLDKSQSKNGIYDVQQAVLEYNHLNYKEQEQKGSSESGQSSIRISNIQLLNAKNDEQKEFLQGEEMKIQITVEGQGKNMSDKTPITIGLAFYDRDNTNISGPNSLGKKFTLGDKVIQCVVPKIPFNKGEYLITVAVLDEFAGKRYDLIDKGKSFFVNTSETIHGKIVMDLQWKKS